MVARKTCPEKWKGSECFFYEGHKGPHMSVGDYIKKDSNLFGHFYILWGSYYSYPEDLLALHRSLDISYDDETGWGIHPSDEKTINILTRFFVKILDRFPKRRNDDE